MKSRTVGLFALLVVVLAFAHMGPHKQWTHGHEHNVLTAAWLVSGGWAVHRDFFCHHPPVPFWLAAPAVRLFGCDSATYRWTLLAFYVATFALLLHANRRSARPFSLGLFALCVAFGHVLYWGHLYIADNLFAFSILIVFYHFWRCDEQHAMRWGDWAAVSLAVFLSVGSALVASYPLALLAIGLAVKYFRFELRERRLARALAVCAIVAAPFALAGIYLLATGSLDDFWEQVFRGSVYHYRAETGYAWLAPVLAPLGFFAQNLQSALLLFVESLLTGHGAVECALAWANVGVAIRLAAMGRWALALFYLAYVFTLMLRMGIQHQAPYFVHSLWAAAFVLQPVGQRVTETWRSFRRGDSAPLVAYPDVLRTAAAALLLALLAQAYVAEIVAARPPEAPEKEIARLCREMTLPEEPIAVFPYQSEIYRFANRKPAFFSYVYWPWQEHVKDLRRKMVQEIESQKAKLIVINWWFPAIGGFAFHTYADEIRDAIRRNYQPLSIGMPLIYARNASFYELLGRYERIRQRPVFEVPTRSLLPLAVFGPTDVIQYFALKDAITSAKLEVLISAMRPSDSWADLVFGFISGRGKEEVLVRERLRTAEVRYFPGETSRMYWHVLSLAPAGALSAGQRHFFRLRAPFCDLPEAVQVWTAVRQEREDIGDAVYGGAATSRTVCFRLSGVSRGEQRGGYPIVEQSLARASVRMRSLELDTATSTAELCQTVTIPVATRISAVSLLLGRNGQNATSAPYRLRLLGRGDRSRAVQTFLPPRAEREWQTITFPPVFFRKGERLKLAIDCDAPSTASVLWFWTAGGNVYWGGAMSFAGQEQDDDLCFKLYESLAPKDGLPDIAIAAVDFRPGAPASVAPRRSVDFTLRVENRGTSATGPFWVEFFSSPKDFSAPMAFAADSLRMASLGPGEVFEQTISRNLYPLADGSYAIRVVADRIGEVLEANEENNSYPVDGKDLLVTAHETQVNLFVDQFKIKSRRIERGRAIEIVGLVSNNGASPAGRFVVEFWAARDSDQRAPRLPICEPIFVESLAPNGIVDLADYPRTLNTEMPTGRLYLGCTADARDQVAELSEADNTAIVGPVTVEP